VKGRMIFTVLLAWVPMLAFATVNLCSKFVPARDKQFTDTYLINFATLTVLNNKVSGNFTHDFGKNNKPTARIISGTCTGNQITFNWRDGSFMGALSGALTCANGIYNISNIIATINSKSTLIAAMISPSAGPCPS